jgi:GDP/UDP-N,N'-diacetylbacillosamine 2-epimerase (hydrolysing)
MHNIGIFTSSRADFGILRNIANKIENNKEYRLKIFVAGSHLSIHFGNTINEIKKDKFSKIIKCKNIVLRKNQVDISKSLSNLNKIFFKQVSKNNIDAIILLGDRYELLPVSAICFSKKIKIIHLHGGETTLGAIDNQIRHAVSLLSDFHFVATKKSQLKLQNLGIKKDKIFHIGAPGLETITENLKTKKFLEKKFNFKFFKNNIIVSLHPETLTKKSLEYLDIFLKSIKKFPNINFIFSSPGADSDGYKMKIRIMRHVKKQSNCLFFNSLGHKEYLSFVKFSNLVIGNSSSGIIEAPTLNKISIDLGLRQLGRERSVSVKNVPFNKYKIESAIKYYIKNKNKNLKFKNPYYLYKKPSDIFLKKLKKCL